MAARLNGNSLRALRRVRRLARLDGFASSSPRCSSRAELDGDLAELYAAYRAELDRLDLWDRELERRHAVERAGRRPRCVGPRPVFAYGFEDLTGAEWALLEALAGRADVTVSLPYEPGRDAFESLSRTADDLTAARGRPHRGTAAERRVAHAGARPRGALPLRIDLPERSPESAGRPFPRRRRHARDARARRRRDASPCSARERRPRRSRSSARRWSAGARRSRPRSATLGVPYSLEGRLRLGQTPFGQALLVLLRFAWLGGGAPRALLVPALAVLRARRAPTPTSSKAGCADGACQAARVEEETITLRGQPLPLLDRVRDAADPLAAVARPRAGDARAPPTGSRRRRSTRPPGSTCARTRPSRGSSSELEGWRALGGEAHPRRGRGPLERTRRCGAAVRARPDASRCSTSFAHAPAASRSCSCSDSRRAACRAARRARRSSTTTRRPSSSARRAAAGCCGPTPSARDRYLFYTACTRADAAPLPRPRGGERRGLAARGEPVLGRGAARSSPGRGRAVDAAPAALSADLAARGRTDRARAPARAGLARPGASPRRPTALARANGWERRLDRALDAFRRPTRLTHPLVLEELRQQASFYVTELERFADCSSMWFVERLLQPRTSTPRSTPRLRGTVAHQTLFSFFGGLPKRTARSGRAAENLEQALRSCASACDDALQAHLRIEVPELERRELEHSLARDLEALVRARGRVAEPARAGPLRGLVRLGALGPGATARPRPRRLHRLGEDRPDRPRPVRRARDGRGLQVGPQRPHRGRDRAGATPADPAVHARPPRPRRGRAARRALPRAGGRGPGRAASCGPSARGRSCPASSATTTSTRMRSGAGSSARRTDARAIVARIRAGDVRHDPQRRLLPAVVRPVADVPGEALVSTSLAMCVFRPSRLCWLGRLRRWPGTSGPRGAR